MIATDYREKLSLINTTRESFTDCMLIDENTPNKPLTWRIIMHWLTEITLDNRELSQYHAYAHVFTFCKYNYSFFFCTFSAPNFIIMVQGMSLTRPPPPPTRCTQGTQGTCTCTCTCLHTFWQIYIIMKQYATVLSIFTQ